MKTILRLLFLLLLLFNGAALFSQTLVQQQWSDSGGTAGYKRNFITGTTDNAGNTIVVENTQNNITGSHFMITKYDPSGVQLWQNDYHNAIGYNAFGTWISFHTYGTSVYCTGGAIYVAGVLYVYSEAGNASFLFAKISGDDGSLIWTDAYEGDYGGNDIATGITGDGAGYLYIQGTEQTDSFASEWTFLKVDTDDDNWDWVSHWDSSVGLTNLPEYMVMDSAGVFVVGIYNYDIASLEMDFVQINADDGSETTYGDTLPIENSSLFAYAKNDIKELVGVQLDGSGHFYILALIDSDGYEGRYRLTRYPGLWVKEWSAPWGIYTQPTALALDPLDDFITISAIVTKPTGGTDAVTLAYRDSTLLWQQKISAPNPATIAMANDIALDANDNAYIAGAITQGGYLNYLTHSYDTSGNLRWLKMYTACSTCNSIAQDILLDNNGNPVVSGISINGTDSMYGTVAYTQTTLSSQFTVDSVTGSPLYMQHEIIVKFNKSVVNAAAVNNPNLLFGNPYTFLDSAAATTLINGLPSPGNDNGFMVSKIFTRLKTTDTISISRLGERIPIPDFWTAFLISYTNLESRDVENELQLCAQLRHQFSFVESAELDRIATLGSPVPNDYYYSNPDTGQFSLRPPNPSVPGMPADINVEEAWNYTTGKPYIKVGLLDSWLQYDHPDFFAGPITAFNDTLGGGVVKDGRDYISGSNITLPQTDNDHATWCGGIIGAVRNNSKGIAGIAGGDSSINPGVSLYDFEVFYGSKPTRTATARNFLNAMVEASTYTPDSSLYGMNIVNISLQILPPGADFSPLDTFYLFKEAFHYASRNKVTMPAITGNQGEPYLDLPAALDTDWMLAVGGTGIYGDYFGCCDAFIPNYGYGIDIAAPAALALVLTTNANATAPYIAENGTSVAAPHVSGVAALLMSYLNDSVPAYKNLAPEDIEYIIARSAFNIDTPGYNLLTGYGRLNAGGALSIVDTAKRKLHHFDSDTLSITNTYTLTDANHLIYLSDLVKNDTGNMLQMAYYKADIYQITCNLSIGLGSTDTIVAYWPRASSSFTYPHLPDDTTLLPHERIEITGINNSTAFVIGYVYHLYDSSTHQSLGWLPFDTARGKTANFAISVLTGSAIYSSLDTIYNSVESVKTENAFLQLYPNPADDYAIIEAASDCQDNVKLSLYDMQGEEIQTIFSGKLIATAKKFVVSTTALATGMYFVTMKSACESKSLKLLKF